MMDAFIDHGRDLTFSYAAVKQLQGKYLVQIALRVVSMRVHNFFTFSAASLFAHYPAATRMIGITFHQVVSTFKLSLPTQLCLHSHAHPSVFFVCID